VGKREEDTSSKRRKNIYSYTYSWSVKRPKYEADHFPLSRAEVKNVWTCISIRPYLLTYLLTPWSRVLLEKPTGSAASQEVPRIFGTRMFITVLTIARHLSLS